MTNIDFTILDAKLDKIMSLIEKQKVEKEQEERMVKCIVCGHHVQNDWNWCPWCRYKLPKLN